MLDQVVALDPDPEQGAAGRSDEVLQAAMPTAILVAIISKENNIVPPFVTSVVLFSTLASLVTLTVIMVLL